VGKRGIVAGVKTPEERGHPAAAWIVAARETLGLSDRQVVDRLGKYDESTLRKAEGHSDHLSRPMWLALVPLYQVEAATQGKTLPTPPSFRERPRSGEAPSAEGALAAAVREQTQVMADLVAELKATRLAQPDLSEVVSRAVTAALQAAGVHAG